MSNSLVGQTEGTLHSEMKIFSTFIPGAASMARNVVNRDVRSASRPQHKVITFVSQGHVLLSMGDTERNPRSAVVASSRWWSVS